MAARARPRFAVLGIAIAGLVAAPAAALRPVGNPLALDPGRDRHAVVRDGFLYSTTDAGLEIVDVRAPAAGYATVARQPGSFGAIEVVAARAYLVGPGGLSIFDVSDRTRPRPLGALAVAGRPLDVALAGPLAYVATDPLGVVVVDVA